MRPQAAGGGAATRRRTVPNGLFRKSYPENPNARTFVSATTQITQAQVAAPPRVDPRPALPRPLELPPPRSPPLSGHETLGQSAPRISKSTLPPRIHLSHVTYPVRTAATIALTVPTTFSTATSKIPTIQVLRFAKSALVA